ncbi:MAG TPA: pitrilysin family protein [Candidatus Paceibacterota bacterium]
MKPFQKIILPNGLRVILVPQKENVATTILVLVEAGSKYETKEINGLSHFLEHMCFKGTIKRPKAIDIAGELDGLGAEYNAFTSQEWTGYFAKVEAHKNEKALEIISDLYLNPVFDAAEIEKEKGVIIEEINMYEDMPNRKVHDLFMALVYGDQPAGWDIAGRKEIIRKLTREDFLKYRGEHYVSKATVIVVAGAFEPEEFKKKIEAQFQHMPDGPKSGKVPTKEHQEKPELKIQFKESDQTHLVLGCRAFDAFDSRRFALEVLGDVLGGGMSSRLFQRVREQLGAAYYVRADANLFSDHGYFGVAAGVDHAKMEIVLKAILEELKKVVNEPIPEEELQRAKDHLTGRLLLGLETSDSMATYYGGQEILKQEIMAPDALAKKISEVKADELTAIAKDIFQDKKLNMAVIGPYKKEDNILKLLRFS